MNAKEQKITLMPPACIDMGVHFYQPLLPFEPDVEVVSSTNKELREVMVNYLDADVQIEKCEVEIVDCRTEYGQCFRAYRLLSLEGLSARTHILPASEEGGLPNAEIKGVVVIEDYWGRRPYIIDRWYDTEKERDHDLDYDTSPDLIAAMHLLTRPVLRGI